MTDLVQFIVKKLDDPKLEIEDRQFYHLVLNFATGLDSEPGCHEFVDDYVNKHKIEVRPDGIYRRGDLVRNHKVLMYEIHQFWKKFKKAHGLKSQITREDIGLEFESISERQWDAKRLCLRDHLCSTPDMTKFKKKVMQLASYWCGALYQDVESVDFRLVCAFIGHFVWQVMTKLHLGPQEVLKTGHESMLLLYSSQQKTGKSTSVRYLISPFAEYGYVWNTDFARLGDDFSLHNLAYNYIACFDDAGRANMRDMARFKRIVTDPEISFRAMYTQTEIVMPKNATLIGTSNKRIRELMHDTSGLRRFHEVHVNTGKAYHHDGINLDEVVKFDYCELYRCCPIGSNYNILFEFVSEQELDEYEDAIRPRHVVELWLNERGYQNQGAGTGEIIPVMELYDNFVAYCSENGYSGSFVPTSESFRSKLTDMGFQTGRSAKQRGLRIFLDLPDEIELDTGGG